MKCRTCRKEIEPGAKKCVECDSYQDWRRFLAMGNTTLALLVALISVITAALPAIEKLLQEGTATVTGVVGMAEVDLSTPIDLSVPSREVTSLLLLLTNSGDRDALIATVWVWPDQDTLSYQGRFHSDLEIATKLLIPAKSSRALLAYFDGKYDDSIAVAIDYYCDSPGFQRHYLPWHRIPPAVTKANLSDQQMMGTMPTSMQPPWMPFTPLPPYDTAAWNKLGGMPTDFKY